MILITRPLAQATNLKSLINNLGIKTALFPTFEINKIKAEIPKQKFDVIIFISANAVDYAEQYFNNIIVEPISIFTIGPITAKKLIEKDIKVDGYPKNNSSSKVLLNMPYFKDLRDSEILIVRGKGGSEYLKNTLQVKNNVNYFEVYERVPCDLTRLHLQSIKEFLKVDDGVIVINSLESLSLMIELVNKESKIFLDQFKAREMIVLSDRIKKQAKILGFKKITVTLNPSDQDVVDLLGSKNNKKITRI